MRAQHKLQLIHNDVCGPMHTTSLGGNIYFVLFIDDFSKYGWVYPMKTKAEVFKHFQHFKTMVENELGAKIQILCIDNGGEYLSNDFKQFLASTCIKHHLITPYTPQQNGVAKHCNKTTMEMVRCMIQH